ncbi:hypothetical protein JTE90_027489 [Oedothorax gibbosus]|uniref:Uncharacterized protein n=1 Tax=Oedothorax gibbosus TaxID=931172 RepID=A0AAV6TI75_9ARAC|nr:hypothetical protein JTE90_027489 [Oedothorax gibbosus]
MSRQHTLDNNIATRSPGPPHDHQRGSRCHLSEMLYGTTVSLPGEFLQLSNQLSHDEPSTFLQHLRKAMCELSPANTSWHNKPFHYVHPSLKTCTHVFFA